MVEAEKWTLKQVQSDGKRRVAAPQSRDGEARRAAAAGAAASRSSCPRQARKEFRTSERIRVESGRLKIGFLTSSHPALFSVPALPPSSYTASYRIFARYAVMALLQPASVEIIAGSESPSSNDVE